MKRNNRHILWFLCFSISLFIAPAIASFAQSAPAQEEEQTFDFGSVDKKELISAEKPPPPGRPVFYVLPGLGFLIVFILIVILWFKSEGKSEWQGFSLSRLPASFKLAITLCLSVYGLVHIIALINVFIQTRIVYKSVEEYFFYMPIQKLTGTTHAHLFGHATMYALTTLAFMFTRVPEKIKIPVVAAAFLGAPFDLYSWWLIKYFGGKYEILSAISGAAISLAFLTMYGCVYHELWLKKERKLI